VTDAESTLAGVRAWRGTMRAAGLQADAVRVAIAVGPLAVAVVAWTVSLRGVDPRAMSSLGLISVVPAGALVALALLCVGFAFQLRRSRPAQIVLLLHVVALIVMVYGLPAIVEPEPRFAVSWRHVGVIDAINAAGSVDPRIDAYFNWPGFFAGAALVTGAAGLGDALPLTAWAPVAFELLAIAPLLLIMRALTADVRLWWLAIWCFYLTNWIGQDYFSPQAFAFQLYLVVLAIVLTWLRATPPRPVRWARVPAVDAGREHPRPLAPAARVALVGVVVLLTAVIVASHQLTPFAVLPGLTMLVLLRRCSARGLPLMVGVVVAVWLSYMAESYLIGHSGALTGSIGRLDTVLSKNVDARLQGADGHVVVARGRLLLVLSLWALAAAGAFRRARRGHDDLTPMVLGAGPFVLPLLQPYGGEILMRIFLFALPFTAFFLAGLVLTLSDRWKQTTTVAVIAVTGSALAGSLLVARYGNEQMDWFSREEVQVVDRAYALAPPGSTLVAWAASLPWKGKDYTDHRYRVVADTPAWRGIALLPAGSARQVGALRRAMAGERRGAYLVLSRSQSAQGELTGSGGAGTVDRLRRALAGSPAFRTLYANRDGSVFTIRSRARTRTP
jgi:hypothetical protein